MGSNKHHASRSQGLHLTADVIVIGGGPAGTWAALTARAHGAERVVLVDKGYCGTSGPTASANTGVWYIAPEGDAREHAIQKRLQLSEGLGRRETMEHVLETTWRQIAQLAAWGFQFPEQDNGVQFRANLRGPDYMAFMRKLIKRAGVTVLDHSPALELVVSEDGVAGARGYRLHSDEAYSVSAGAVVVASGGVAYLSKTLGCDVNTGDGLLMAAEAGAELSGMEFSSQYGICPAYSSVTKGLPYFWATFSDAAGRVIHKGGLWQLTVAEALLEGPVFAVLDRAPPHVQHWLRVGQPNCFLPHDRLGIDPFRERFPITLRSEGTVRGTGGIRIIDRSGRTRVAGLYAAGDAASRETLVGAATGGGAPNAAWVISSGTWSGQAAAAFAREQARESIGLSPAGEAGLRPRRAAGQVDVEALIARAQAEALPIDKNLFRSADKMRASLAQLDAAWQDARNHLAASGRAAVRAREAAALLACARLGYRSALTRVETRGLHRRRDAPGLDPAQAHSLASVGLDDIEVRPYRYQEGTSA
jgi:succinate dehydrogenase/fumarate reductase flavoprotein subunit